MMANIVLACLTSSALTALIQGVFMRRLRSVEAEVKLSNVALSMIEGLRQELREVKSQLQNEIEDKRRLHNEIVELRIAYESLRAKSAGAHSEQS